MTRCRVSYDEKLSDIKKKTEKNLGVPADKIQFFWHKKELVDSKFAEKTLYELDMHTGFTISGYDMRKPPNYFPGVVKQEDGSLKIFTPGLDDESENVVPHTKGYLAFNGKDIVDPSILMEA